MNGSFTDPWAGTTNALRGVVLKRVESIGGQFLQGNQAGSITVAATPFLVTQSVANVTLPAVTAALSEGGLVRFQNDGVVTFTNAITVAYDTSIDANGHNVLFSGGGVTRLLTVQSNVNFSAHGLAFANGRQVGMNGADTTPPQSGEDGSGAGMLNLGGFVALTNCVLTNFFVQGGDATAASAADAALGGRGLGAAICSLGGRVTLQSCLLADNTAVGGRGSWVPAPALVSTGTNFTFQALAIGTEPIGYSWIKDDVLLADAINATLVLMNIQAANGGRYAAVANNSFGSATSMVATLTVDSRPLILTEPGDVTVAPGATTNLSVIADGPALNYVWLHNDVLIPRATNASLIISNAAPGAQGTYQVIAMNFAGVANSRVASVSFSSLALNILSPPQSVSVAEGDSANFNVLASGIEPIRYQWLFESVPLLLETNSWLSFAGAALTNAGVYRVVVTNAYLAITSAPAVLTVVSRPTLSIATESTNILITCRGVPGRVHRLFSANDLAPGAAWTAVATNSLSGAGTVVWTLPAPTNGAAYYRAATP